MTDALPRRAIAVYGALRSGTTLLRLMLDANPALSCPGETDFIFDHLTTVGGKPACDEAALERDRIYRAHRGLYAGQPLARITPDALIDRIAGAGRIAVLMLHRNLSRALSLYPDLRIVHFLRDPRDVAKSSIGMGWAGNVYYGIDHWIETEADFQRVAGRLAPGQLLTVRYEDLIARPEEVLTGICTFAGCAWDPAMLDYDRTSTYEKPSGAFTVQWKRKQTAREVGLVEGKIGPLLAAVGYEPSGHPPVVPTGLDKLRLRLENKRAIWKERIARFGLRDPLLVAFGHRLGLPALSAPAQRRIEEKTLKYLK